jgi:glutathione S-transferase
MTELIVHHYPQSPVSEKVRLVMGLKNLAWRSVEQNRLPDRPELSAMTGGYRRLPVLQIGAELFCDTQCIFRELERRFPSPSLFPNGESGLAFALSRWTDSTMFDLAMRISFAPLTKNLPAALVADRTRLYLGPSGDFEKEIADLPHTFAQLRAQLGWLDDGLSVGRPFLLGDKAGLADVMAWFIVWFLRGRSAQADQLLSEFAQIEAWEQRMKTIGYGQPAAMSAPEALAVARDATPVTTEVGDPRDPQGFRPDMMVSISPLGNTGETPISGRLLVVSRESIAIARNDPTCADVVVHFPRVGYRIMAE